MYNKILKLLSDADEFISGESIANNFGITRSAVWKNINKLKNMGYNIVSINNKGYLLNKNNNIYNSFEITKNLKTKLFGKKCYFFEEIDSTNTYAKKIASDNESEGVIVVSNFQTKGKGRLDKAWFCEKDKAIYLSLILKPNIPLINSNQITLISGIALCKVLKNLKINAKIKWPNDIILNNKKIAGILTELNAEIDKINYIIMGIGINVNNTIFEKDLTKKASSLFLEMGEIFDRKLILNNFLLEFEKMYNEYIEFLNFEPFLNEYKSLCLNLNKNVTLKYKNKKINGKVIDISTYGSLILLDENNKKIEINSGEVSIRNTNGEYI